MIKNEGSFSFRDVTLLNSLIEALNYASVAICVCDTDDNVRFVNDAFGEAFFGGAPCLGAEFAVILTDTMMRGQSLRHTFVTVDEFAARVRLRRRNTSERHEFTIEMADGRWFKVEEHRISTDWTVSIATDVTLIKHEEIRLEAAHQKAMQAAHTDFLTGLPNRRAGIERAEVCFDKFLMTHMPLSLAILDIDYFKAINDKHGHETGDRILIHFSHHLADASSEYFHASRIGGEEFLLVMPNWTEALAVAGVSAMASGLQPYVRDYASQPIRYTFSAGIASAIASESLSDVLGRADDALYRAKANGRDRVEAGSCVGLQADIA